MATIVTRAGKGSALTHNEVDANFTNLNTDKVEKSGTDPVVISVNSSTDALRITQTGTGNALVVEDSTNPDSTPFVVDKDGIVISGYTSYDSSWFSSGNSPTIWQVANTSNRVGFGSINYNGPGGLSLFRAGGGVIGTEGSVASGDVVGVVTFAGYDGTTSNAIPTAVIRSEVDGTPGTNDMPGRLVFLTTADGASTSTERMRIDNAGNISLASAGTVSNQRVRLAGNFTQGTTGSGNSFGFIQAGTVQSDVTNLFVTYRSEARTAAASFALGNYWHFQASQASIGAGSSISSQIGFLAENTLTGATNNYGFYSNIASGTGRWNFYANGTADNYFAGSVGIGGTAAAGVTLQVSKNATGSTNTRGVTSGGTIQSDSTASYNGFRSSVTTAAASFTLADLSHFVANQNTLGAGSTVTAQYGFNASSTLTGATNNYGFFSNIASGTGRWNFYANGTAENYLGGNLKIGGTAARATTAGTNQLVLFDGTAPVGTLANGVSFYSASGEARVMDAAGNSTLLSPHDSATNEWIFHSKHTPTGKVLRIDVEKMLRFINDHFGLDMIQEFTEE